jgi:hypothetical protein
MKNVMLLLLAAGVGVTLAGCANGREPATGGPRVYGNAGVEMRSQNLSRVFNQGPPY